VDCWDGQDGKPVVNHGRTLSTSIPFSDCIEVIGRYAFCSSPYPLIISLEVHCGTEQQLAMTNILKSMLGSQLLTEAISSTAELPSPEDLKYRILIKVKAGEEHDESSAPTPGRHRSASSPSVRPATADRPSMAMSPMTANTALPRRSPSVWDGNSAQRHVAGWPASATEDSDREGPLRPPEARPKRKKSSKISQPLGALAVYTRGQKFSALALPESYVYNHVFSFSERTFEGLCRDSKLKAQLENHAERHLLRVYPAAYRITSLNFDPVKVR
ncbi:MAG: hypothetical protein M1823_006272, partial [Watsoniomyces obsoletus]